MNPLSPNIIIATVVVVALLAAIACFKLILRIFGVIIIPQDSNANGTRPPHSPTPIRVLAVHATAGAKAIS